jgi:hypothetical protein
MTIYCSEMQVCNKHNVYVQLTTISFFTREYIRKFYRNKHIVFIGDSLMRHIYRDFICHLQHDRLVTPAEMWDAVSVCMKGID